jgi:hypothetical protein
VSDDTIAALMARLREHWGVLHIDDYGTSIVCVANRDPHMRNAEPHQAYRGPDLLTVLKAAVEAEQV